MGRHSSTKSTMGRNAAIGALAVALTGGGAAAAALGLEAAHDPATRPVPGVAAGSPSAGAPAAPAGDVAASPAGAVVPVPPAESVCRSGRSVNLTTTPEMAPTLMRLANAAEKHAGADCVRYVVTAAPAGVTADKILVANAKTPDIWVPDSPVWVEEVAKEAGMDLPFGQVVASSPVGLALPKRLVDGGARTGTHTWVELVQGGHAAMAAADPEYSTASMLALVSASKAAAASPAAKKALTTNLTAISRNIRDDVELMRVAANNAADAPAFPASEQQMATERSTPGAAPVSALTIPDERLSFQYGVVPFPTDGDEATRAADALRAEMTSADGAKVLRDAGFRAAGGSVAGVPGMDVPADQVAATPVAIGHGEFEATQDAWNAVIATMRALVAIDVSGSMREHIDPADTRIELASAATDQAVKELSDEAVIGLWAFSDKIGANGESWKELAPLAPMAATAPGYADQRARLSAIGKQLPTMIGGGTALYDTISAAVKRVQTDYDPTRTNAVVVWTDGVNRDGGALTKDQLLAQLRATSTSDKPVRVLLVGMGADSDMKVLNDIAHASGGSAFAAKGEGALPSVLQTLLTGRVERAGEDG